MAPQLQPPSMFRPSEGKGMLTRPQAKTNAGSVMNEFKASVDKRILQCGQRTNASAGEATRRMRK
jgi:hypothetical protein